MGAIVGFDWQKFVKAYPVFASLGEPAVEQYWIIATTMHRNDGGGPIGNPDLQATLLNALTAHVAYLFSPKDAAGQPSATGTYADGRVSGRISSASEGSVSVQMEALSAFSTAQAQWLATTVYGQFYWAATASFRTIRYRPFYDVRRAVR